MQRFNPRTFLLSPGPGRATLDYRKGSIVFRQSAAADSVCFLDSGRVKLTAGSRHGRAAVVGIVAPGEFFGEGALAGQAHRTATAEAMTSCRVVRLQKAAMLRLLEEQPAVARLFGKHLLARAARLEEDLIDQLLNPTEKRLGRALLMLARLDHARTPHVITTPINQRTLAEMVGTTRPRVSHFMTKFRRMGLISGDRERLHVHGSLLKQVIDL